MCRRLACVGALALTLALSGCDSNEGKTADKVVVFTLGDETVYLDEVNIYATAVRQEYERDYGSGIWTVELNNEDGEAQTIEEITKEDVIEEMVQVKVLAASADTYGVALTQEENAEIEAQAEAFVNGLTDAERRDLGIDTELARKVYEQNAIAGKVYDRIMAAGQVEISEEDCRQTTIYDMFFSYYKEEGDTFTPMDDTEKAEVHQRAVDAYQRVTSVDDPLTVESAAFEFGATEGVTYTMDREGFLGQFGEDITAQIYDATDGSVFGPVEGTDGCHVIQLIAWNDEAATAEKKQAMMEDVRREYFQEVFAEHLAKVEKDWKFSKNVKQSAFDMIRFTDEEAQTTETTNE